MIDQTAGMQFANALRNALQIPTFILNILYEHYLKPSLKMSF